MSGKNIYMIKNFLNFLMKKILKIHLSISPPSTHYVDFMNFMHQFRVLLQNGNQIGGWTEDEEINALFFG
jgi:hypothetical protein